MPIMLSTYMTMAKAATAEVPPYFSRKIFRMSPIMAEEILVKNSLEPLAMMRRNWAKGIFSQV